MSTAQQPQNRVPSPRGAERPAPPLLIAEDVIACRFRVLRLLGRGGTGEVYEAEDLVLRSPLALKVLRPDAATDQGRERFRREVLLARRVTHPNVCRVFDLYEHTVRDEADGDVTLRFLTMELLHGETLAALVARREALPTAEALPLVRQMAAALAAAHRADVVHRDFKSANVMLVASDGAERVVVTDFGLARALEIDDGSSSRSAPLVGTWAYMSPEQVEGRAVGAAADIYAFGVVLYEMVTGRRPFRADTALATALQRMHEPPPPPSRYVPDLDPRWEAVILRCLARDPEERFERVEDVVSALSASTTDATAPAARRRRRSRHAGLVLVASAAVAVMMGPALSRARRATGARGGAGEPTLVARPPGRRPAVALLGFNNLSGRRDTVWLSTALAEMLGTELALGGRLRAIPGENVSRMKLELAIGDADSLAGDTLRRVRANVGADLVVLGSYLDLGGEPGGRIRLEVRVQDAASGETTAAFTEEGRESDLSDLVSRLGVRLRDRLGAGGEPVAPILTRSALPASVDALRLYAEGLAALRNLDAQAAARILQHAVDLEPGSPLVRAALAEAWTALGSDRRARQEAEKAYELSTSLSQEERRWVEGRYREAAQDWGHAVAAYSDLWKAYPDNIEYGLHLAAAQTSKGSPRDALATLAALRRMPGPAAEDPRIDLTESEADHTLADFERARQVAVAAAAKGTQQTARLLLARARLQEARALERLGDSRQATARFAEAQRLFAATGDNASVSWTNLYLGLLRFSEGEPEQARLLYTRALDGFDALGHRKGRAATLTHLAMVHWKQGRLAQARTMAEEALAAFRELDDKASIARVSNNLALLSQNVGDLERARGLYDEALSIARQIGDKRTVGITLGNVADVTAERGDLRGAEKLYEEALAVEESIGLKMNVGMTLSHAADLRLQMGDVDRARAGHQRALDLRTKLGQKLMMAESRLALGRVALESGHAREAERLARAALDEFRREAMADDEALGAALLASALAAEGRGREARAEAGRAREVGQRSLNQLIRLTVAVASARVDSTAGGEGAAARGRRDLESALAEARRSGRRGVEMEARLALAEGLLRSGGPAGRATAAALEKDARALGYGLVARKAGLLAAAATSAALAPPP